MKLLKRKILFCLASEIDFFKISEGFEYYPYKFLYDRLLNYKSSSIRDAALQLAASGEIDKITRNKTVLFRLTAQGRNRLLSFFPISIGQRKVWDRVWRIAIINSKSQPKAGRPLDEKVNSSRHSGALLRQPADQDKLATEFNRDTIGLCQLVDPSRMTNNSLRKLRTALKKLSFKKFSRGVYLTPLPISAQLKDFLLKEKFSVKIAVIESRRLLLGDDKQLAKRVWSLNSLLNEYFDFINQAKGLLKKIEGQNSLTNKAKKQFSFILDFFFSLLEKDPGLPKKLLPSDWPFGLVKETFLRLTHRMKIKRYSSI